MFKNCCCCCFEHKSSNRDNNTNQDLDSISYTDPAKVIKVGVGGDTYDKGRHNLANINDTGDQQMRKVIVNGGLNAPARFVFVYFSSFKIACDRVYVCTRSLEETPQASLQSW